MNKIKIDMHVHTNASPDGFTTPKMAVRAAVKRGLGGIAVTDHNTVANLETLRLHAPKDFIIIPGAEYSTEYGHVLALFCEDFFTGKRINGLFSFSALCDFVKEKNGLLVLAHPFQGKKEIPETVFEQVHGLEAVNARALLRDPTSSERVITAAARHGLFTTGGSDGHFPGEIGNAYTEIPMGKDIKEGLLSGLCTADGEKSRLLYKAFSRLLMRMKA